MKKPKKPGTGKKRLQKRNRQGQLHKAPGTSPASPIAWSQGEKTGPNGQPGAQHRIRSRSHRVDEDGKRKLWDRKQAELETRWQLAQTRRAEEYATHKRKMRIVYTATGIVMIVLALALTWYFV